MKLRRNIFSFRNRVVVIIVGVSLGALSILYTNKMAQRLKEKEQHDVALWAHAMERVNRDVLGGSLNDPLVQDIMSNGNNIPFLITDENLQVLQSHLVPERILEHPDRLRRRIDRFTEENTPLPIRFLWNSDHYHIIFYGQSNLLKSLYYFPYVQLLSSRRSCCWAISRSGRRSRTNRIACGSDWPKRPPTNSALRPRRYWDGSNTCVRRRSTKALSRR